MQVRTLVSPPAPEDALLEQAALHSTLGAILLWSGVLVSEWPLLMAGRALCGEPEGLLGHCPLCWPAAVLTGVAATLLIATFRSAERRA